MFLPQSGCWASRPVSYGRDQTCQDMRPLHHHNKTTQTCQEFSLGWSRACSPAHMWSHVRDQGAGDQSFPYFGPSMFSLSPVGLFYTEKHSWPPAYGTDVLETILAQTYINLVLLVSYMGLQYLYCEVVNCPPTMHLTQSPVTSANSSFVS